MLFRSLDPIIAKLKRGDRSVLSTITNLKGFTEVQNASTAIQSKGFKIGG